MALFAWPPDSRRRSGHGFFFAIVASLVVFGTACQPYITYTAEPGQIIVAILEDGGPECTHALLTRHAVRHAQPNVDVRWYYDGVCDGYFDYNSTLQGFKQATRDGANIIVMPFGSRERTWESTEFDRNLSISNRILVGSSGNSNGPPIYPARHPNVLAVAGGCEGIWCWWTADGDTRGPAWVTTDMGVTVFVATSGAAVFTGVSIANALAECGRAEVWSWGVAPCPVK